jgi:Phage capsid family
MENGSLPDTSVGYRILDDGVKVGMKDGLPIYKFKWAPYEWSIVTIAADIGVGSGRGQRNHIPESDLKEISIDAEHAASVASGTRNAPLVNMTRSMKTTPEQQNENDEVRIDEHHESERSGEQEQARIVELTAIAKRCEVPDKDLQQAIKNNIPCKAFRKYVMDNYWGKPKPLNTPWNGDGFRDGMDHPTVAGQIISHPEFQKLREGGRKRISFTLPNVRSLHELNRSTVTTADVGTTVMQVPGVQGVAFERLTVADLLAQGTTNSGKVQYPREESFNADATNVAESAAKPEQDFDVEPAESSVRKIAVWTKLSTELIEDSPAAEAYVRARLGFSVQKREDAQLLSGDGLGSNILGILSTPGLQTRNKSTDTVLDAIRKGIGDVEENTDFMCTGVVVNVHDWANIEMLKDSQNRYLVGQVTLPDEFGRPRLAPALWGRPVAVSKESLRALF